MEKKKWGRFFTTYSWLINLLVDLKQHTEISILEPCCGEGHIVSKLEEKHTVTALDIIVPIHKQCKTDIMNFNFFLYPITNKFKTIITNPPYVSYRVFDNSILDTFESCLPRTNLYMYFIEKMFYHLEDNGELILIIPIDFINNTRGINLRKLLYENGNITHIINLSDRKVFTDCSPDVIIMRYQKNNTTNTMKYKETFESDYINVSNKLDNGIFHFYNEINYSYLKDYFDIKVGLVIGCNNIFEKDTELSVPILMSDYIKSKQRRYFIYLNNLTLDQIKQYPEIYNYINEHKNTLLNRKVIQFNETNWWKWGAARNIQFMNLDTDCIYVNQRTRNKEPFFIHKSCYFDGTIIALIPKQNNCDLNMWINILNNNPDMFKNQGLLLGNKFMLNKIKLENLKIANNFL